MIIEKRIKFSANQHEIETTLKGDERVIFQGEAEVSATTTKPLGDGSELVIYTLKPLLVQIQGSDPIYNTPKQTAKPKNKSKSEELRNILYVYWSQQLSGKYPNFDKYYNAYMDKHIDNIKEKLQ